MFNKYNIIMETSNNKNLGIEYSRCILTSHPPAGKGYFCTFFEETDWVFFFNTALKSTIVIKLIKDYQKYFLSRENIFINICNLS